MFLFLLTFYYSSVSAHAQETTHYFYTPTFIPGKLRRVLDSSEGKGTTKTIKATLPDELTYAEMWILSCCVFSGTKCATVDAVDGQG